MIYELCFFVMQQEQKTVEREYQYFPADMLVNKQASELPAAVDPAVKEVRMCVYFCKPSCLL